MRIAQQKTKEENKELKDELTQMIQVSIEFRAQINKIYQKSDQKRRLMIEQSDQKKGLMMEQNPSLE